MTLTSKKPHKKTEPGKQLSKKIDAASSCIGEIGERKIYFAKNADNPVDLAEIFARLIVGETKEEVEEYCYKNGWMTEEEITARRRFRKIQTQNYSGYKRRHKKI